MSEKSTTRNMSRRDFLRAASTGATGLALAASNMALAADRPVMPSGQETVTLVWDTFRGPGTGWNEERIESFKETHPNVEVEFRPLAGSSQQDNYGKMYALYAAGDLGDIVAFDPSHYHFWRAINAGIIGSIQDLAEADNLDQSQWFEQFMTLQYYQGELYGLPSWGWAGHDTLVINKVHFDEAGIEPPDPTGHETSMDTYAEWARRFYVEGERFGLAYRWSDSMVSVLCRIWNTDFINVEGTQCLLLDDENAQAALRWAYDLSVVEKIIAPASDAQNRNAAQLEGKITMNWNGAVNVRAFARDIQDSAIAEAWQGLFPVRDDGRYPTEIRGGTWNMNAGTAHPQEAYEFIKHLAGFEGSMGINNVAGELALTRPDVLDALIEQEPIHAWFLPNLQNGIPAHSPANSRGGEFTDALVQGFQILMDPNNPVDFDQGIQDYHNTVQAVLDKDPA